MSPAASSLSKTLNAPLPDDVAALPPEDLNALDAMLRAALADRSTAMDRAIKASLDHAPRLARPAIKKVLGL